MYHHCPKCGRSFHTGNWARVTCRECGTSWNTSSSQFGFMELAGCFFMVWLFMELGSALWSGFYLGAIPWGIPIIMWAKQNWS